jgi:hypothetical protein
MSIEERKAALEAAKTKRPSLPNLKFEEVVLDEYAYQVGEMEQYTYIGVSKQDSGMRRGNEVGYQDGIRLKSPRLSYTEPLRKGVIQVLPDGTQITTDIVGKYLHFAEVKEILEKYVKG